MSLDWTAIMCLKSTAAPLLMEENQKHVEPRVSDVHEAHVMRANMVKFCDFIVYMLRTFYNDKCPSEPCMRLHVSTTRCLFEICAAMSG
jgi:hypothetical protein